MEERSLGEVLGKVVSGVFRGFIERSVRLVMSKDFFILKHSLPVKVFFVGFTV